MSHAKSLAAFRDVEIVLDEALKRGGCTYTLPSQPAATAWRHRAYTFRTRLRALDEPAAEYERRHPKSKYDQMTITNVVGHPGKLKVAFATARGIIEDLPDDERHSEQPGPDLLAEAERLLRDGDIL